MAVKIFSSHTAEASKAIEIFKETIQLDVKDNVQPEVLPEIYRRTTSKWLRWRNVSSRGVAT